MAPAKISAAVGSGARNKPIDVAMVKFLLTKALGAGAMLNVDGEADDDLDDALDAFVQQTAPSVGTASPAGSRSPPVAAAVATVVRPNDVTWRALVAAAGVATDPIEELRRLIPNDTAMSAALVGAFVELYRREIGAAPAGLMTLANFIAFDPLVRDLRWFAYMLGTAWLETAHTYDPVREIGLGRQFYYGKPTPFTDRAGRSYNNVYYGRGYVQLTLLDNYRAMDNRLGLGQQLESDPDKVLQPAVAYPVMTIGMREGMFTHINRTIIDPAVHGVARRHVVSVPQTLAMFITGGLCDYYNARRIINLRDYPTYKPIADMALKHELLLKLALRAQMKD